MKKIKYNNKRKEVQILKNKRTYKIEQLCYLKNSFEVILFPVEFLVCSNDFYTFL